MSDPRWREGHPSRPYAGQPGATPYAAGPDGVSYASGPGATPYGRGPWPPAGGPGVPARGPGGPGTPGGPRRDGQPPRREADGNGHYPGGDGPRRRGPRWEDGGPDAPTSQLPAQPGVAERGDPAVQRTPDPGSRRLPAGPPRPRLKWGSLQGGLGVCLIVGSTAIGAIATMAMRSAPGLMLGVFVVIGTLAAALAVRPSAGRLIFPVPALSYLVAALIAGIIYNRSDDSSKAALAIAATQWIASGFFAMALATAVAVVLITVRWYLWRTRHGAGGSVPQSGPASRSQAAPAAFADSRYPDSRHPDSRYPDSRYPDSRYPDSRYPDPRYPDPRYPADARDRGPGPAGAGAGSWNDASRNNERPPGRERGYRPPGSGPYNFSSGA